MHFLEPASGRTPESDHVALAAQWRYEATRRLQWLLATTRSATPFSLLEVGSGSGFFLHAAQQVGIEAHGVELSPIAVRFARTRLGVHVRHGVFEAGAPPDPVAAVCAFGAMERSEDPQEFLAAVRRALGPQGWLALEVDNAESAALRETGAPAGDELSGRPYSPRSLTGLLEASRFVVHRRDTVFRRYFLHPRRRMSVSGGRALFADWARAGTPRLRHPGLGDRIRVLARVQTVSPRSSRVQQRAVRS